MMKGILLLLAILGAVVAQTSDPQRPVYHFLPEKNWMNDPNGPMYFNGVYHLFFQYNPFAAYGNGTAMHWGHAASKDMVHWQWLPIALYPDHPYDAHGVWSGSATIVNGVPTLTYTGINLSGDEAQCTATPADISDPLLINWNKTATNPIIPNPPPEIQPLAGFRDPTTGWKGEDGNWYMEVGSGENGKGACTLLYTSPDYLNWTFLQRLYNATYWLGGGMFECPDFYVLNGTTHLYKASAGGEGTRFDIWMTGNLVDNTFVPFFNKMGFFDYGIFYASKSFYDPVGARRVVFGWVEEDDSEASSNARGWAGMQTLPREVILNEDMTISQLPVKEVESLQGNTLAFPGLKVNDEEISLNFTQGDQVRINVNFTFIEGEPYRFGLKIRAAPNESEYTLIYFVPEVAFMQNYDLPGNDFLGIPLNYSDPAICRDLCFENTQCYSYAYAPPGQEAPSAMCYLKRFLPTITPKTGTVSGIKPLLVVDRTVSSLAPDANKANQYAPLGFPPRNMQVFIDHSIVEVYVNDGRHNLVSRIYPILPASQNIAVFAQGGAVGMDVDIWEMSSSWN